jgi:hypothetical protein
LWATSDQPYPHKETLSRFESASVMLEIKLDQQTYNQASRVLLVGGQGTFPELPDLSEHLDTAELFDAQAAAWRWTGCGAGDPDPCQTQTKMQKVRKYPKTVLLPNGLVLIVGGEGNPVLPGIT